jgi:hypothetical protein
VVFWAVALADGKADSGERGCFLEYVQRTTHADPLLRMLCDRLTEQGADALQVSEQEQDFPTYLTAIRRILESTLSPQERTSFLAGLLCLGHHVASASGGFFGLGNRISPVEAARLEEVSALLGLTELLEQA